MKAPHVYILLLGLGLSLGAPQRHASETGGQEAAPAQRPLVLTATLDDQAIAPGSVRYLERAIDVAEARQAECIVIILDTPGGLLTSTRALTRHILASEVPVVVYVAPSGARAASAGLFITLASHVAAMAPGTTIGAAHPVQIEGFPLGPDPPEPDDENDETESDNDSPPAARGAVEEKIVADTVSWARALAELRDRNAEWAEDAVRRSASIIASEAVEKGVVELVADDMDDLLAGIDGREVVTEVGPVVLNTADAEVQPVDVGWGEWVLMIISQPNVAFLLMIFGFYGLLFELYSPEWGIIGTLGAVCIVLAMFGLAVLPVDFLGLALIVVALGLMVAEVFVTSYGALSVAGAVCLVVGAMMLIDDPGRLARVSLAVVVPIAVATVLITLVLVGGILRSFRAAPRTGGEGMIGKMARAMGDFAPHDGEFRGTVAVHGERWRAVCPEPLKANANCRVVAREGLTLTVEPIPPPA